MNNDYLSRVLGNLARVYIEGRSPENRALGIFEGNKVVVNYGKNHIGEECLVRFDADSRVNINRLMANYIRRAFQEDPKLIPFNQYVLLALWENRMEHTGRFPTIDEINRYYDPSDLQRAYLISEDPDVKKGDRVFIYWDESHIHKVSISQMIKRLTINRRARMILTESTQRLESLANTIKELGLIPIVMEALR